MFFQQVKATLQAVVIWEVHSTVVVPVSGTGGLFQVKHKQSDEPSCSSPDGCEGGSNHPCEWHACGWRHRQIFQQMIPRIWISDYTASVLLPPSDRQWAVHTFDCVPLIWPLGFRSPFVWCQLAVPSAHPALPWAQLWLAQQQRLIWTCTFSAPKTPLTSVLLTALVWHLCHSCFLL